MDYLHIKKIGCGFPKQKTFSFATFQKFPKTGNIARRKGFTYWTRSKIMPVIFVRLVSI